MTNIFIFSYLKETLTGTDSQIQNHLVLFFPYKGNIGVKDDIQQQLREYFYRNVLPDKLYIIGLEYNKEEILTLFEEGSDMYDFIPKFSFSQDFNQISVFFIDMFGEFTSVLGKLPKDQEIQDIYNRGLIKIFLNNGGLIVSQPAHHFVFPSGKHSNRFLRPGNVLIHGSEILFIASALVRHFKRNKFTHLYSDTSSINSLAYAYIGMLKDLNPKFTESVIIESFGSYRLFEKQKFKAKRGTVFLISSSTSGSILKRMTSSENLANNIDLSNIAIIYGLNVKSPYLKQVICDLSLDENNNESLESFESYNVSKGELCRFCNAGSKPLKVEGDVFLLEKPIVTSHLIKRTDLPLFIQKFSAYYKKKENSDEPLIRCYFKEGAYSDKKYEIYIDLVKVLNEWNNRGESGHPFVPIFQKLEKYILQNVPASLKYMLVLPDDSSFKLAKIIQQVLNEHGCAFLDENIIGIDNSSLKKINKKTTGTLAIISSCIVTGRNLLYLSRALREFEKSYQRIFFSLINRTGNKSQYDFLQSNLGLGEFGVDLTRYLMLKLFSVIVRRKIRLGMWKKIL